MKNYYAVLEIKVTATADEITASYKRLMKQWHPDVNKEAGAIEKTKELNEAYATLGNPEKKRSYDLQQNPFDRTPQGFPQGFRSTWGYGKSNMNMNIVIVDTPTGQQVWVNGVRQQ